MKTLKSLLIGIIYLSAHSSIYSITRHEIRIQKEKEIENCIQTVENLTNSIQYDLHEINKNIRLEQAKELLGIIIPSLQNKDELPLTKKIKLLKQKMKQAKHLKKNCQYLLNELPEPEDEDTQEEMA